MSRRLALLAAVPLATLAAAAPAAAAPAASPPQTAAPAQGIFLDYGDLESPYSTSVVVLIGVNDYGLVPRPG